jgi:glycosyltransferase involved in cell wall biosynthesis
MPKASIIIPFYNQGYWLNDAVDSALAQDFEDYDIILINDGSTDPVSNRVFEQIEHAQVRKFSTDNLGLARARNAAIGESRATYILPLDSDDRIAPSYLRKAVEILETKPNLGIVYSNVELFGEEQGVWKMEPYSFPEVLISPQIVASAVYRRSDWEKVGGYKSDMIYGWEDYDFWLSLIETGVDVYRIPEVLFYYRRTQGSMAGLDRQKMLYSFNKLFEHHKELYEKNIGVLFNAVIDSDPYREHLAAQETFEIYIPGDGGYVARNTRIHRYSKGIWSRICFQVFEPVDNNTHQLRLDPGSSIGVFDIASIKIFDAIDQKLLYTANDTDSFAQIALSGSASKIENERFLRILNTGSDPYFYLPELSDIIRDHPIVLEVWIRYKSNISELKSNFKIVHESNEQLVKIRDLEENLRFHREQEQLLKYQEFSLREELQNLRNNQTLLESEVNTQHGIAKSIQSEFFSLQSEHRQLIRDRDALSTELDNLRSQLSEKEAALQALMNKPPEKPEGGKKWF